MKKVLIVDDETKIRELYARLLRAVGLTVLEATDAWEATDLLMKQKVDLVLLDLNMPEVDGKEMFDVIQEFNPQMEIIVFSVYPVDQQKKILSQATEYFDKSEGPFNLLEKMNHILYEKESIVS